jgi:hypothetical protein
MAEGALLLYVHMQCMQAYYSLRSPSDCIARTVARLVVRVWCPVQHLALALNQKLFRYSLQDQEIMKILVVLSIFS